MRIENSCTQLYIVPYKMEVKYNREEVKGQHAFWMRVQVNGAGEVCPR